MKSIEYIKKFQDLHYLSKEDVAFFLDCETMHKAWNKSEKLHILHIISLNCGLISKQEYVRIITAYTQRFAYNYDINENIFFCVLSNTQ